MEQQNEARARGAGILRNFEILCGQLAEAAERGEVTAAEFESATGRSSEKIRETIFTSTKANYGQALKAISGDVTAATSAVFAQLECGNLTREQVDEILGATYNTKAKSVSVKIGQSADHE